MEITQNVLKQPVGQWKNQKGNQKYHETNEYGKANTTTSTMQQIQM